MSNYYQPAPQGKDPILWEMAQGRASFKSHLLTYLIVNAFLWALWYVTGISHNSVRSHDFHGQFGQRLDGA